MPRRIRQRQQSQQHQPSVSTGKLSVLTLALSSALAAMAPAQAQTQYTTTQSWSANDYVISSSTSINVGSGTGVTAGSGTLGTLINNGTIFGGTTGLSNTSSGTITAVINNNGGRITGATGIYNGSGGSIQTLSNSGVIIGFASSAAGINNGGFISTLTNSGTIIASATSHGQAINNSGSISTLTNNGILQAASFYGNAILNSGNIGTLINNATLIATSGTGNGLSNSGNIGALTNYGAILAANPDGHAINNSGTIGTLTNYGTISGGRFGIESSGVITVINNSGLIAGSYSAIALDGSSTLGTLINTGVIAGQISNATSAMLTIVGGSGSTFGTLTGSSIGITANDVTLLYSTYGVIFTGNQLLNDNVYVPVGGATNLGTLQVDHAITITGNYLQGSGATLIAGVVSSTDYGSLVVNGNATLDDSTVTVKPVSYALASGQRYVVVEASGALSATDVTYSATGYKASGSTITSGGYNELVVTIGGPLSSNATNSNAAAALNGLIQYGGTNTSLLAVYNPALALDAADANKAGAQLSPAAVSGAVTQAAGAASQAVSNVATSRMDGFRVAQGGGSGVATGERATDIALWGQFFGGRAAQGERDGISGYHGNYTGLLLGADTAVSDTVRAGGLFSASKTSVALDGDNTGTSGSVNSYGLTAYGRYSGAPWYVDVQAGAARQQYSTTRDISYTGFSGVANGSFNGQQLRTSVEAGYPLNIDAWLPGATLTPIAGLNYSSLRTNGYTESGGSGAALTVSSSTDVSLKSELGAKLENTYATSYGKLLPSVQLGWRHEYRDDALQTGASFAADSTGSTAFVAKSAAPVANLGVLNLGVTLLKSENLSLSAKYTLEVGGGYTAQTGSVQVRYTY